MLKSFSVENFRNLKIPKMDYTKTNILIGPNNSGKTNLVQALSFFPDLIGNTTKGSAFHEEVRKRGWVDILRRGNDQTGIVKMKWVINLDTVEGFPQLTYELDFGVEKDAPYPEGVEIVNEQLWYQNPVSGKSQPFRFVTCHDKVAGTGKFTVRKLVDGKYRYSRISLKVENTEIFFRQTKILLDNDKFRLDAYPVFIRTVELVDEFFERFRTYSSTSFALEKIRSAQKIDTETKLLDSNGVNFVNVLANLEKKYGFLKFFISKMKILLPQLEDLNVVLDSDDKRYLQVRFDGNNFKLSEMSDGTVKAFLLGLLLWSPEKLKVLTLDEPELNIHPAWLRAYAEWIQTSDSVEQVFLSTHSPDLLDHFTEGFRRGEVALFVCNVNGDSSVEQVEPERLEIFFSNGYQLGDLYRVGEPRLGGWPL